MEWVMTFGLAVAFCEPASVFFFVCQLTAAVPGVVSLTRNLEPVFLELQKPRLLLPVLSLMPHSAHQETQFGQCPVSLSCYFTNAFDLL